MVSIIYVVCALPLSRLLGYSLLTLASRPHYLLSKSLGIFNSMVLSPTYFQPNKHSTSKSHFKHLLIFTSQSSLGELAQCLWQACVHTPRPQCHVTISFNFQCNFCDITWPQEYKYQVLT